MEKFHKFQVMTLAELQKFQRLYTLSRLASKYKKYYIIYISIDVEGWNNMFREIVCGPIGREFFAKLTDKDKEYGTFMQSRLAEVLGYECETMVNGDDLRVILMIPRSEVPREHLFQHLQ